jgi:putative ABC transport system substrate-binding protein
MVEPLASSVRSNAPEKNPERFVPARSNIDFSDISIRHQPDIVRFKPDVILVGPSNALLPLRKETSTIPIVFVRVSDPVGQGIVTSLARPSGNITGFSNLEFSLVGKWLQSLKEIAPSVKRVAMIIHTGNAVSANWFRQFETLAPTFCGRTDCSSDK